MKSGFGSAGGVVPPPFDGGGELLPEPPPPQPATRARIALNMSNRLSCPSEENMAYLVINDSRSSRIPRRSTTWYDPCRRQPVAKTMQYDVINVTIVA